MSAGAAKSARGSPHDRTCLLPPRFRLFLASPLLSLPLSSLFVILFLGPEYYDFVLEGFVGRSAIDVTKRWHSRFYPIPFKWNMCMKIKDKSKSMQRRNVSNVEAKDVPRIFTEDGGLMIPVVIVGTRGKCRERAPSCKVIIPRFYACSRYKATNARGRRKR